MTTGHKKPVAVQPAETEICAAFGQGDAADQRALGVKDLHAVQPWRSHTPAAPEIAVNIAAHAVWRADAGIDEDPIVLQEFAIDDVECMDCPVRRGR